MKGKINSNELYYFILSFVGKVAPAVFTKSTMTELINSGNVRLISNRKLVADLTDYFERKIAQTNFYIPKQEQIDIMDNEANEFINMSYFNYRPELDKNIQVVDSLGVFNLAKIRSCYPALKLQTVKPQKWQKYYNQIIKFKINLRQYNKILDECKDVAEHLKKEIKTEYNF